jgi:hypothetical protein
MDAHSRRRESVQLGAPGGLEDLDSLIALGQLEMKDCDEQ